MYYNGSNPFSEMTNFLNRGGDHEFGSVILPNSGPNFARGSGQFRFEPRFRITPLLSVTRCHCSRRLLVWDRVISSLRLQCACVFGQSHGLHMLRLSPCQGLMLLTFMLNLGVSRCMFRSVVSKGPFLARTIVQAVQYKLRWQFRYAADHAAIRFPQKRVCRRAQGFFPLPPPKVPARVTMAEAKCVAGYPWVCCHTWL